MLLVTAAVVSFVKVSVFEVFSVLFGPTDIDKTCSSCFILSAEIDDIVVGVRVCVCVKLRSICLAAFFPIFFPAFAASVAAADRLLSSILALRYDLLGLFGVFTVFTLDESNCLRFKGSGPDERDFCGLSTEV